MNSKQRKQAKKIRKLVALGKEAEQIAQRAAETEEERSQLLEHLESSVTSSEKLVEVSAKLEAQVAELQARDELRVKAIEELDRKLDDANKHVQELVSRNDELEKLDRDTKKLRRRKQELQDENAQLKRRIARLELAILEGKQQTLGVVAAGVPQDDFGLAMSGDSQALARAINERMDVLR